MTDFSFEDPAPDILPTGEVLPDPVITRPALSELCEGGGDFITQHIRDNFGILRAYPHNRETSTDLSKPSKLYSVLFAEFMAYDVLEALLVLAETGRFGPEEELALAHYMPIAFSLSGARNASLSFGLARDSHYDEIENFRPVYSRLCPNGTREFISVMRIKIGVRKRISEAAFAIGGAWVLMCVNSDAMGRARVDPFWLIEGIFHSAKIFKESVGYETSAARRMVQGQAERFLDA